MVRRLRIYVANYDAKFVLVNELSGNLTGDYFAEKAILFRHSFQLDRALILTFHCSLVITLRFPLRFAARRF